MRRQKTRVSLLAITTVATIALSEARPLGRPSLQPGKASGSKNRKVTGGQFDILSRLAVLAPRPTKKFHAHES